MVGVREPRPDHVSKANAYMADVLSGKIPACKWVRLACQRQLDDLAREGTEDFPYIFDAAQANRVCKFIEKFPHVQGFKGKLRLEPWQCFVTTSVFGWLHRDTGLRRFRRVYTEVGRGNGKSAWTAPIGLYMAFMDGEPGAEVYVAAVTRDQTDHVFKLAAQPMVRRTPEFMSRYGIEVTSNTIVQQSTASLFRALASRTNSLDSLNIHFGIIDELHAHPTREVYESLDSGTGKRDNSMLWMITTAGTDRSGICYDRRDYVIKILEKTLKAETWFGIIYSIDEGDDWATPEAAQKANPNWGVSVKPSDILPKLLEARQLASAASNYKTKHLCVWVGADAAWMDMLRWAKCADPKLEEDEFQGQNCIVALDLSSKLALTAKAKIFWKALPTEIVDRKTGEKSKQTRLHWYVFLDCWTPQARIEESRNSQYKAWAQDSWLRTCSGETIDYDDMESNIRDEIKLFRVLEVAFDPWHDHTIVNHLQAEGITVVEVPQLPKNLSEPMKELEAAVYDGRFHFNGDPILTWAVSNVVAQPDRNDNLFPAKERAENLIDPATALLTALNRAMVNASINEGQGVTAFGDCEKCGALCIGHVLGDKLVYRCEAHGGMVN
jgi:phage terminase large subunit-like protein